MTEVTDPITEARHTYLEMRAAGHSVEIAATTAGISLDSARRWEEQIVLRKERLGKAADKTASRLMAAAKAGDAETVAAILGPLDLERTRAVAVAAAVRAIGGAADCVCEHLDLFHNLNAKNERTRCDWSEGSQATPCGCKRFQEAS